MGGAGARRRPDDDNEDGRDAMGALAQRKLARSQQDVADAGGRVPQEERGRLSWAAMAPASLLVKARSGLINCRRLMAFTKRRVIKKIDYERC